MGAKPGGGYGLRVSRPGFDVTNTGLTGQQLSFDSDWLATAKIHAQGSVSVPLGSFGYTTVSFPTLGVIPAVIAYADRSGTLRAITLGNGDRYYSGWPDSFPANPIQVFTDHVNFVQFPSTAGGAYVAHYIVMSPL